MFRQDFTCPALLEDLRRLFLPVRGCHPLWPPFQTVPVLPVDPIRTTGLVRVRSPLPTESSVDVPFLRVLEMFQFRVSFLPAYGFSGMTFGWVAPFGNPRIKACCGSPRLIAACHVLHRPWRQGIHQCPA